MPQSRTRYQRAAMRSKYRKPKRRRSGSFGWNAAIAIVVIAGIVAVVLTRGSGNSAGSGPPRAPNQAANVAGDHWHTALDVDICGEWLDVPPAFEKPFDNPNGLVTTGIHSHGDGVIHVEPQTSADEGDNATVGKFFGYGGWGLSADSIDLGGANSAHTQWQGPASDAKKTQWSTGDACPFGQYKGKKVELTWAVDGKVKRGNPSDYHPQNGETIAVYLLPKGAEEPFPPDACSALAKNGASTVDKNSPCLSQATTTTPATTAPVTSTP